MCEFNVCSGHVTNRLGKMKKTLKGTNIAKQIRILARESKASWVEVYRSYHTVIEVNPHKI